MERRLAAKSNPRWRVEKGKRRKNTMAAIQEGESCQETARLVPALFLLRGISGLKNRFTIFCGKFRGNE